MLDRNEFKNIRNDLEKFEEERENLIQNSRDIIKLSKQIIYAIHRDELEIAYSLVEDIKKLVYKVKGNYDTNINNVALQEYVEALCYFEFIKSKKIPARGELCVDTESYLSGLCDLTGELTRKAVDCVIKKKYVLVLEIKDLVEEIYGEFLTFNLRNGDLRKKMDAIKYNLRKIEDVIFSLEVKKPL